MGNPKVFDHHGVEIIPERMQIGREYFIYLKDSGYVLYTPEGRNRNERRKHESDFRRKHRND